MRRTVFPAMLRPHRYRIRTDERVWIWHGIPPVGAPSAVAPLWAGLIARINQGLNKPVGLINPLLYAAPANATFRDITQGNNGDYKAGAGWDACTGLGSPNGQNLLLALMS
jgi:kumamolisin